MCLEPNTHTPPFALLQMQHAHDLLSELESKPADVPSAPDLKPKKRSQQVLCRTEHAFDHLESSGESELEVSSLVQPHDGGAAAIDFSDVSLDWGLGKLERCTNLPDFSSRVLQVILAQGFISLQRFLFNHCADLVPRELCQPLP